MGISRLRIVIVTLVIAVYSQSVKAQAPQTLRVDYYHSGNASQEIFSLDRVVLEPLVFRAISISPSIKRFAENMYLKSWMPAMGNCPGLAALAAFTGNGKPPAKRKE